MSDSHSFPGLTGAQVSLQVGQFNVKSYGATGDGTTNDFTAVQAAITAAELVGGTVYFPAGTYRINSQIVLPNDGAATPKQRSVRLTGDGAFFNGQGGAPYGGSILDLRYAGSVAKIVTFGSGTLEIDHLCITDYGTSSTPFIHATNTTLLVHENGFVGNLAKATTTCDQDVIILGGLTTTVDGTATSPFQGYGTFISENFFDRVRRCVLFQTFANGIVVRANTVWLHCGSNVGGSAAAFEIAPLAGQYCTGNVIQNNLIESIGYVYPIRLQTAHQNSLISNNFFDPVTVTAFIRFENDAIYNLVLAGFNDGSKPLISDATAATNTIIQSHLDKETYFSQPVRLKNVNFAGPMIVSLGGGGFLIQPSAAASENAILASIKRSAAEGTNPGTDIFQVQQNGYVVIGGSSAGAIDFRNQAGTVVAQFTASLKNWIAAGSMSQDSGAGGSYFDHKNYAVRFFDHAGGPLRAVIGANLDGMTFGALSDTNLYRSAANTLKTDDALIVAGALTALTVTSTTPAAGAFTTLITTSTGTDYATKALQVRSSTPTGLFSVTSDGRVYVGTDTGAAAYLTVTKASGSALALASFKDASQTGTPELAFTAGANNMQIILANVATGKIHFGNGGLNTQQVTLDTALGNLGIAITTPSAKLDINSDILRLRTAKTPASAAAAGNAGDIAWDATYFYVCIANATWHRVLHATW